jgi:hypothetical protein
MKRKLLMTFIAAFIFVGVNAQSLGKAPIKNSDPNIESEMRSGKIDLNTKFISSDLKTGLNKGKLTYISETFDSEIPGTWTVNNTGTGSLPGWFLGRYIYG